MLSSKPPVREGLRPKSSKEHLSNLAQKRYMSVCFVYSASSAVPVDQDSNVIAIVICSSSDGTLTVLALMCNPHQWKAIAYLKYHKCPVLSLTCTGNNSSVYSGATDGCIAIWNVQTLVDKFLTSSREEWVTASHLPVHTFDNAHQSGVNCLTAITMNGSTNSEYVRLISGGDDQCLGCMDIRVQQPGSVAVQGPSNLLSSGKNKQLCVGQSRVINSHASAVRGVGISNKFLFSVGLDQKVRCWDLTSEANCRNEETAEELPSLMELATLSCDVPDPTGLAVMPNVCNVSEGKAIHCVVIVGRGVQVVNFVPGYSPGPLASSF